MRLFKACLALVVLSACHHVSSTDVGSLPAPNLGYPEPALKDQLITVRCETSESLGGKPASWGTSRCGHGDVSCVQRWSVGERSIELITNATIPQVAILVYKDGLQTDRWSIPLNQKSAFTSSDGELTLTAECNTSS